MTKRDFDDYIRDIHESAVAVRGFIEGMSEKEFIFDKKTHFAVTRAIEVIGEAVKNIPKPFRVKHPNVPWKEMAGMRDKLVHEYFGIDLRVLWKTAREDIPQIEELFQAFAREKKFK